MRNEQGRSLTEMLGTLAIMGILSVVGIWMYGVAMDKLRANELINEAQKRAVVVAGQIGLMGRKDPTLVEFTDNAFAGGTFATEVTTQGLYQQFGIKVSGVNKRICQNIVNGIGNSSPIRRLSPANNPQTIFESCADDSTFLMIYNNDLSGAENDTKYCQDDGGCKTVCGTCNSTTHLCENECPEVEPDACVTDADCQTEGALCAGCNQNTHTCQACQRVAYLESDGKQWIDSGIECTSSVKVKFKGAVATRVNLACTGGISTQNSPIYFRHHWTLFSSNFYWSQNDDSNFSAIQNNTWTVNTPYEVEIDPVNGSAVINGQTTFFQHLPEGLTTGKNYGIFARISDTGTIQSRPSTFYYFKIYDGNTLMRDFIPVLDPQGVLAMYDKVSKTLFYNAGTGDFKTN